MKQCCVQQVVDTAKTLFGLSIIGPVTRTPRIISHYDGLMPSLWRSVVYLLLELIFCHSHGSREIGINCDFLSLKARLQIMLSCVRKAVKIVRGGRTIFGEWVTFLQPVRYSASGGKVFDMTILHNNTGSCWGM